MIEELFYKFFRFGVVGVIGTGVDFGITWVLKEKLRSNRYFANAVGFLMGATNNYLLNRYWTFDSHNPDIASEYAKFLAVALVGLGLNTLIIWLLDKKLNTPFYWAKLLATGVVLFWNFGINYLFTFAS